MPVRVLATLTKAHTRCVAASADGSDFNQHGIAFGLALVHQRAKPADKVDADVRRCLIQRLRKHGIVIQAAARGNLRDRGHRYTFVDDGHAELPCDVVAYRHQVFRQPVYLLPDVVAAYRRVGRDAVAQRYAHRNGAHIQVFGIDHLDRIQHFVFGDHRFLLLPHLEPQQNYLALLYPRARGDANAISGHYMYSIPAVFVPLFGCPLCGFMRFPPPARPKILRNIEQ